MKQLLKYIAFLIIPFIAACSDNENWTIVTDVQPGVYVSGSATVFSDEAPASALKMVTLDQDVAEYPEVVGIYTWLKASGDFQISMAAVANEVVKYGKGNQITNTATVETYSLAQDAAPFKVAKDGIYYIVVNTALKQVNILPVNLGVIGAATPNGWNGETSLGEVVFDETSLNATWKGKVNMSPGEYKFRYSGDWGYHIAFDEAGATARLFTDLGITGNDVAPLTDGGFTEVKPGGKNISTAFGGEFEFTVKYSVRNRTFTASYEILGDPVVPPTYPEMMYLVGDATAYGWDTPGTAAAAEMHKLAGGGNNDGIYWKILFLEGGKGFKVSNANWGSVNLGFGEITAFDSDGVTVTDNGGNMSIATSGMYTIVLDLRNNEKKLSVSNAKVYGIGDAFGGWDSNVAENLFATDNAAKTLISRALPASGNIRMYASHSWIPDWWNAEFNVYSTQIEYRNDGGDQPAVEGTSGQVITLHFDDNTGSIQ